MEFPTSHAFQQKLLSPLPPRSSWLCSGSWSSSHNVFSFLVCGWCCTVGASLFLSKLLFFIITLIGILFCQNSICDLVHICVKCTICCKVLVNDLHVFMVRPCAFQTCPFASWINNYRCILKTNITKNFLISRFKMGSIKFVWFLPLSFWVVVMWWKVHILAI